MPFTRFPLLSIRQNKTEPVGQEYRLILREEDGLLESQGEFYCAYLKTVPRLGPALTPRVQAAKSPRGQANFRRNVFWLFGVAVPCFALPLKIKLTGWSSFRVSQFTLWPSLSLEYGRPHPPRVLGRPGEGELPQWRTNSRTDAATRQPPAPLRDLRALRVPWAAAAGPSALACKRPRAWPADA
jgi:hypothetical protein